MSALDRLARRCAAEPVFLAHAVARYQQLHGLGDEALAAELGCAVEVLARVRLCGMPRAGVFAADCAAIAERFGVRADVVERIAWPWQFVASLCRQNRLRLTQTIPEMKWARFRIDGLN